MSSCSMAVNAPCFVEGVQYLLYLLLYKLKPLLLGFVPILSPLTSEGIIVMVSSATDGCTTAELEEICDAF